MSGLICFIFGYFINIFYISVLYHRGLAHRSVILGPTLLKLVQYTGIWVTGLDPLSWITMHRIHHIHSDEKNDPHSPLNGGIFNVWVSQYKSYISIYEKLKFRSDENIQQLTHDIPFQVSKVNSNLPYIFHLLISLFIGWQLENWYSGVGYFIGIMGHPIHGWMINALAHKFGQRNFDIPDNSKNNLILGFLIFGEGLQNNHHANPQNANFSVKFPELDPGYYCCKFFELIGLLKVSNIRS